MLLLVPCACLFLAEHCFLESVFFSLPYLPNSGNEEILRMLLEDGANPEAPSGHDGNPYFGLVPILVVLGCRA